MNCREFNEKIELYVLGGLSDFDRNRADKHCECCDDCRITFEITQNVQDSIRAETQVSHEHSAAFFRRLELAATENTASNPLISLRMKFPGRKIALAASVLLACGTGIIFFRQPWKTTGDTTLNVLQATDQNAAETVFTLQQAWQHTNVRTLQSSLAHLPAAYNGKVMVMKENGKDGFIAAIDILTGRQVWHSDVAMYGYIAADQNRVLGVIKAENLKSGLAALDLATGALLWKFIPHRPAGAHHSLSKPMAKGRAVFWAHGDMLYRINAETGAVEWSTRSGEILNASSPLAGINDDQLLVVSNEGVHCFRSQDGVKLWMTKFRDRSSSMHMPFACTQDDRVFASRRLLDGCGVISCHSSSTGKLVWERTNVAGYHLLADKNAVYVRSQTIRALSAENGATLWSSNVSGCSPLSRSGSYLFVADAYNNGKVLSIDVRNGCAAPVMADISSCTGLVLAEGMGFVSGNNGVLYGMRTLSAHKG